MIRSDLGRHVYGAAAAAFGVITSVWHDFNGWQQIRALGNVAHREILVYIAAAMEIFGGVAIQFRKTARAGAAALGTMYLIFALLWVPHIVATPGIYDRWGKLFEQFSLVSGAMIVYSSVSSNDSARAAWLARIGYICFGICVVSFTLEQLSFTFPERQGSFQSGFVPDKCSGDNDHDCVGAGGHRDTHRTFGTANVTTTDSDADWLRFAGLAASSFCRSA